MPIVSDLSDEAALAELRDLQRVERLHHRILNVCGIVLIVWALLRLLIRWKDNGNSN